jgi:Ser/Thr protein kinase RdoA (MazF antagonist)
VTPTISDAAVRAAVTVAARFTINSTEPMVLADGANIVVHLRPAPVVAKVAASTPEVRPRVQDWLQRELDVSAFLAAEGAPVVPPSPELPATTHRGDGHVMSFWRYLPPADPSRPLRPDEETIGSMLRDLHAVLRRYPKALPELAPLQDIPAFLARPQTRIDEESKAALAAAYTRLTAQLASTQEQQALQEQQAQQAQQEQQEQQERQGQQALHGDAGAGNLMATDRGWLWHDFEDTCSGPVAWDLAASTSSRYQDGPRVLAAYREPIDQRQLAVCEQLRWLHLTVWYNLYAERLPELGPRAAELLASWSAG